MEGLHPRDAATERDRGLLVRLSAEQEFKDASEADGEGYGGIAKGRTGVARNAKGANQGIG